MTYRWRFTVTQFDGGQTWIEPSYGEYVADNRIAALHWESFFYGFVAGFLFLFVIIMWRLPR